MTCPLVPHPHATKEQRANVLTSTDVRRLERGEWLEVWNEKTGRADPVDLRFQWKPRLGLVTEDLHAWWHGHTEGVELLKTEDRPCYNPKLDLPAHYASTFDFWCVPDSRPLELKHTNARNTLRQAAEDYMAQLQWQLLICGGDSLRFSIICGNEEPIWGVIDRDEEYIRRLRQQADAFWQMVEQEIPPGESTEPDPVMRQLARQVPINGLKDYDYATNNEWCVLAADYVRLKALADQCDEKNKALKALVPEDAASVIGAGVRVTRNKKGALTLNILKAEEIDQ